MGISVPMKIKQGQCLTGYPQWPRLAFALNFCPIQEYLKQTAMAHLLRGTAFITGAGSGRTTAPRVSTSEAKIKQVSEPVWLINSFGTEYPS